MTHTGRHATQGGMLHREAYWAIPTRVYRAIQGYTYQGVQGCTYQGVYRVIPTRVYIGYTTRVYWAIPPPWVHLSLHRSGTRHPACWPRDEQPALTRTLAELTVRVAGVTIAPRVTIPVSLLVDVPGMLRVPCFFWERGSPVAQSAPLSPTRFTVGR